MQSSLTRRRLLAALPLVAAGGTSAAAQQSVARFYKGRVISLQVPTSPGGINDISARLVAQYLPRYIPGAPTVTVENTPGAGGLLLANDMYHTIANDGLTIGIVERGTMQLAVQGDPNARFDPQKFTWLGSLSSFANDAYLFLVNASFPAKTAADLKKLAVRAKIGGDQPGSTNLIFAQIAQKTLGLNIDVIRGYPGAAPMFVAMQSGELDGQVIGYGSVRAGQQALWSGGKLRPLIQFGRAARLGALPNVPTGRELAPNAAARALIEFAELPFFMALPFLAPPSLPADRAAALRSAFMQAARDPALVKQAQKLQLEISPIGADAIHDLLTKAAATPPEVIAQYNKIVGDGPQGQ
jgi:tripartite-type tricarboxylate transporter receptor subunit TctC